MGKPSKAVILAAGASSRMKTNRVKVLHEICGRPMLAYVLDACWDAGIEEVIVVVGSDREKVQAEFTDVPNLKWAFQEEQLGTGHAVMAARGFLEGFEGDLVVLMGDAPLITPEIVLELLETLENHKADAIILTAELEESTKSFGRIIRSPDGYVERIVEVKDCTPQEREIREVNSGMYAFRTPALVSVLACIGQDNVQEEYYLTDAFALLIGAGKRVSAIQVPSNNDIAAVNSRAELAGVTAILQRRIHGIHMDEGVTIINPGLTQIDWGVTIGQDTVIHPGTVIRSNTEIGRECVIGPYAYLPGGTVIEDHRKVGPMWEETAMDRISKTLEEAITREIPHLIEDIGIKIRNSQNSSANDSASAGNAEAEDKASDG